MKVRYLHAPWGGGFLLYDLCCDGECFVAGQRSLLVMFGPALILSDLLSF